MDETTKAVATAANELLKKLLEVDEAFNVKTAALNSQIQAVKDQHGPDIEELDKQRKALESDLKALVMPRFDELAVKGTKTIKLRAGQISQRLSREALVLTEPEPTIIKRVRAAGGVRKFIRRGKETLDKEALKKDPQFVTKIKGLAIVRNISLVINPSKQQGEIVVTTSEFTISQTKED